MIPNIKGRDNWQTTTEVIQRVFYLIYGIKTNKNGFLYLFMLGRLHEI